MIFYIGMTAAAAVFAGLWQHERAKGKHPVLKTGRFALWANTGMVFACLTFAVLFAVNALSEGSNDYENYIYEFGLINSGGVSNTEPLFQLIVRLVGAAGFDFVLVQALYCLVGYMFLLLCIRDYSSNFAFSVILYVGMGFYMLLGMNQVRQFVALMVLLYAYRYIPKGKFIPYALLAVVAALFHETAIVMLPAYFILRMNLRATHFIAAIAVLAPINLFHNQILTFLFKMFKPQYLGTAYQTRGLYLDIPGTFMAIAVCILLFVYRKRVAHGGELEVMFAKMFLISALITSLCVWLPENARFAYYFNIPAIVLIPSVMMREENKRLRYLILGGFSAAYFLILFIQAPKWGVIPYDPIF